MPATMASAPLVFSVLLITSRSAPLDASSRASTCSSCPRRRSRSAAFKGVTIALVAAGSLGASENPRAGWGTSCAAVTGFVPAGHGPVGAPARSAAV
jgi:hypothetical protein